MDEAEAAARPPVLVGDRRREQLVERAPVVEAGEAVAHGQLPSGCSLSLMSWRVAAAWLARISSTRRDDGVEGAAGAGEDEGAQGAVPRAQGHGEERLRPARALVEDEDGHPVLLARRRCRGGRAPRRCAAPRPPRCALRGPPRASGTPPASRARLDDVARVEVVGHRPPPRPRAARGVARRAQEELAHLGLAREGGEPLRERVDGLELRVQLLAAQRGPRALDAPRRRGRRSRRGGAARSR